MFRDRSWRAVSLLGRRLLGALVTVWLVVTLVFALARLLPADPARALAGPRAAPAVIESIRAELGLDRPLAVQYGRFLGRAVRLDLGVSYATRRPVVPTIVARLPATLELAAAALALELALGVALGCAAAWRRGGLLDRALDLLGLVALSGPTFVWGLLLLYLCAFRLGWFPIGGPGFGGFADRLWHLALPALTLALAGAAYYQRLVRDELDEALAQDYVQAARAKGLSERRVLLRHALRNALLPVITLAGIDLGTLVGGAVVTEAIFGWPGVGQLAVRALFELDLPMLLGTVLLTALGITAANLLADLSCALLDPRIRRPA